MTTVICQGHSSALIELTSFTIPSSKPGWLQWTSNKPLLRWTLNRPLKTGTRQQVPGKCSNEPHTHLIPILVYPVDETPSSLITGLNSRETLHLQLSANDRRPPKESLQVPCQRQGNSYINSISQEFYFSRIRFISFIPSN